MKLTVAIATHNEENNLPKCLESVVGLADEIVVVDGSSTDNTVEVAKSFGAKVLVTNNPKIFHINKQKAINMASSDWILQLDADEIVSKELKKEIKDEVNKHENIYNGYFLPRKNYFLGRFLMKGGQYPDYTVRLYRKGKGYLPQKDVHEQAVVEGKVGYLKKELMHYPYQDFAEYLTKWSRYTNLIAVQIKSELEHKNTAEKVILGVGYSLVKPIHWFLTTYFRHKGIMDSWQGFVFSLFSALRFPVSYFKYLAN